MPQFKLGCHLSPPGDRARALKLRDFRTPLPAMPTHRDWFKKTTGIKMHLNDKIGICTIAGAANLIQVDSANANKECIPADADCLKVYSHLSGYDPKDPETDTGLCLSDVLKYWQNTGMLGRKIGPYLSVDPRDWDEVCFATNTGGALYCGISLPKGWADQTTLWNVPKNKADRKIEGGHCVIIGAYDNDHEKCQTGTWGMTVPTTMNGVAQYFSEIYLVLDPTDWFNKGIAPNGLNMAQIIDAMTQAKKD